MIGAILYHYHVKGWTIKEILDSHLGVYLPHSSIKGIINGYKSKPPTQETQEAMKVFYEMLENEPEMLDKLYETTFETSIS